MNFDDIDFYEFIMGEAEANAKLEEIRKQAVLDWEREQD